MSPKYHTKKLTKAAVNALNKLEEEGRLTPDEVVNKARAKRSPLHQYFTWNNSKAAEKWRQEEARRIIRVRVEVEVGEYVVEVPRFVRDSGATGYEQGYQSLDRAGMSKDTAKATYERELRVCRASLVRIVAISSFLGFKAYLVKRLTKMIDELYEEMQKRKAG